MRIWKVIFKRFSPMEGAFVWVEDTIEADQHRTTDCGVLEFINGWDVVQSIPPGCWMGVEEQKKQSHELPKSE